jgi:hypothetical protein
LLRRRYFQGPLAKRTESIQNCTQFWCF